MLYVYCGTDTETARARARAQVQEAVAAGATVAQLESDSYASGQLQEVASSASLFGGEQVVFLDRPAGHADFLRECVDEATRLAESAHTFVLLERTLTPTQKKTLRAVATAFEEVSADTARFNTFNLADALATRDKKRLWFLLQEANQAGVSSEEIIGVLWWQLKTMLLASRTADAAEADIKPFPYQKAQRALQKFSVVEVEQLGESLLGVYHAGHNGERELDLALEAWVLTI